MTNAKNTVRPFIANRRSPRAFDRDLSVDSEILSSLLEAARWAPSANNIQPWRFIVGQKGDATHKKIASTLSEGNRIWAEHAPLLILNVTQEVGERGKQSYAWHDLGLATTQMILQASSMELYTHVMAGFSKDEARSAFDIPIEYMPLTVIAIGYLGDASNLPEKLQKRENAPRLRKPLEEITFQNTWGESLA
ncbi:MAG: nitroreductase family protein [Anaerolineae bacterium]|jgi:nitroreductase|nr:nitroreductase family protein [Anaerolineae bacterium]MBT4311570.1 nitroreductase family protein [Anaerolineae bacterium]MBT4458851.1 nitroreductase family protein [Anaerolineae bacterium]MBT4842631.1 nitroreductase family protein [Anaerolineae bacterium]MBT6059912.1 nitroreductase family protein [Anaerolineae bacterium]